MSPSPTRLNRRNVDIAVEHVSRRHPNLGAYVWLPEGGHGENAARPCHRHRLAGRKDKDCDRQPPQRVKVQHMNEGRHDGMPRELTLMSIMLAESS